MLPISQKGKNTTIFFIDCHNVVFKENYFFIRRQSFFVGTRKMEKQTEKEIRGKPYPLTLLILNPEPCRECGPRQCLKEDDVCLHLSFPFMFLLGAIAVVK